MLFLSLGTPPPFCPGQVPRFRPPFCPGHYIDFSPILKVRGPQGSFPAQPLYAVMAPLHSDGARNTIVIK